MRTLPLFVLGALAACAPATRAQTPHDPEADLHNATLPPVGFGTLSQSDVAILLRNDEIELQFLPLDERVIRLLAPDSYQALSALVRQRQPAIDSIAASRWCSSSTGTRTARPCAPCSGSRPKTSASRSCATTASRPT